jgi:hypothetical protein
MCLKYYMLPAVAVALKTRRRGRSVLGIRAATTHAVGGATNVGDKSPGRASLLDRVSRRVVKALHFVLGTHDVRHIWAQIHLIKGMPFELYLDGLEEKNAVVKFLTTLEKAENHDQIEAAFNTFKTDLRSKV